MTQLANMPMVLTVEETAEVLRIGRSAAYAAVKTGDLPHIKLGRSIRVPRHQLERLLGLAHLDEEPAANGLEVINPTEATPDEQLPSL